MTRLGQSVSAETADAAVLIDFPSDPNRALNLSELERVVAAHARHYIGLLEREVPRLQGAGYPDGGKGQLLALRRIGIERGNISGVLETALSAEIREWLLPIARHLWHYLSMVSEFKAMQTRYNSLLDIAARLKNVELELQCHLALIRVQSRQPGHALDEVSFIRARELATSLGDRASEATVLSNLGVLEHHRGDFETAHDLFAQSLAISRELGDCWGEASAIQNMGTIRWRQSDYNASRELLRQSLAAWRTMGERNGEAMSLNTLAAVEHTQGNYEAARESFEQSLAMQVELGDRAGQAAALGNLAMMDRLQGSFASARRLQEESLAIKRDLGDRAAEATSLSGLGNIERCEGKLSAARARFTEALDISREIGNRTLEGSNLHNLGMVEILEGALSLGCELFRQSLVIRREMGDQAGALVCCVHGATALTILGHLHRAAVILHGSVRQAHGLGYRFTSEEALMIDHGLDRLTASLESNAQDLANWQAEGESLNLDKLSDFALLALATIA